MTELAAAPFPASLRARPARDHVTNTHARVHPPRPSPNSSLLSANTGCYVKRILMHLYAYKVDLNAYISL